MSKRDVDDIISFILIKKLITPIVKTDGYKLGLVDNAAKVKREPKTEQEKDALTILDRVVFKLKRLLGSRLLNLHSFIYLQTLGNNLYNKLIVKGSVQNRSEIRRIAKDIRQVAEANNTEVEDVMKALIKEELENMEE